MASISNLYSGSTKSSWRTESLFDRTWVRLLLALVLGLIISAVVAVTAVQGGVLFVIPLMLLFPVGILLLRYPFAAILIWMLIFPYVARGTSGIEVPIYYAIHRAMIPAALWIVIMTNWAGLRRKEFVRFGLPEYMMLLSLLWATASIFLFGDHSLRDLVTLYDRLFVPYCLYWLIRLIAPTAQDIKRFLPIAFITLISQAVIGILSWYAPHYVPQQWLGEAGERVVGTFHNPAVYTSTLLFLGLLIFQYGMNSKLLRTRILALAVLVLTYYCVFISYSRGSWLGGALVLLGLFVVYPRVMAGFTVTGLIVAVLLGATVLRNEVAFAAERLATESTAENRVYTGARSIQMITEKPLLGWGYGNYDIYSHEIQVHLNFIVNENDNTSHNTYLTIMAEQGIPALIFYIFPTLYWLGQSLAVWRRLPRRGFWSATMLGVLWLLLLDHFTVSNFMDMIRFNLFGTSVYWIALALVSNMVAPYLQPEQKEAAKVQALQVEESSSYA